MQKLLMRLPIFRRLFLVFLLAAVIPDIVIAIIYWQVTQSHLLNAEQGNSFLLEIILALLFSTGIVFALGYFTHMTITQPLRYLVRLTQRIGNGNTDERAQVTGRDEISIVSASINKMLDNIVYLLQQTQTQRDQLQARIEKLLNEVSGVGEGDLRVEAEVTLDVLGTLADSFNYMVEQLSALVIHVKDNAQQVRSSTTETSYRMNMLVNRTDIQLTHIERAVEEVQQMSVSSRQVAEHVQDLSGKAQQAQRFAADGRQTATKTTEGIHRILVNVQTTTEKVQTLGQHSRNIGEIVNVINDIANHTNRLALDAAIQSAMAGENGKGFGAVAESIRRLAETAKAQTTQISRIVQSVFDEINQVSTAMQETERETASGAALVEETDTTLQMIFRLVEQQAQDTESINQRIQYLLQSATDVAEIMQDVSITTQQSGTSVRAVAQEMNHLAAQAEQLLSIVGVFKLKEAPQPYSISEIPLR
ncbi:hypothetical protein KDA_71680 [Dictyobacter alpinus]|uniref:Methyl-accepting chemotaxis protein n=1 Tax=Dictyobacter alpinus TaxID=2014873 RepID=A0A402BK19_9CHLR|nr:methyl-accepting chemotaxis protein [Dictyobacter alpinus]GCE31684.1 hypothetical protein KDA_71680 [Dictyobacter alpinus]